MSKKKRTEILQERFPEFFKLSNEMNDALDAMIFELEEKLEKIEDIKYKLEEIEEEKAGLDL